ncbi:MAG: hypothetical protein ACLGPM_09685 [Acidobacteriota bacterium]
MADLADEKTAHYIHSTLRERIVEHVFVGDALRRLWQRGVTYVEVLRSEFDAGGYDLVMSHGKIVRHIQFKTIMAGGTTADIKASLRLMGSPAAASSGFSSLGSWTLNLTSGSAALRASRCPISKACGSPNTPKRMPKA